MYTHITKSWREQLVIYSYIAYVAIKIEDIGPLASQIWKV